MITIRHQIASRAESSKFIIAMLTDTHPDAEAVQFELLRRMTSSGKLELMSKLTAVIVALSRQGIRDRHPGLDDNEVDLMFIEMNYGKELADGVRRRHHGEAA